MPEIVVGRNEEDNRKYGTDGTIRMGKHIVGTGEEAHLTTPLLLDVVRPHLITVTGKRGEGKSFTIGVIAEEIIGLSENIRNNLSIIIIDTQGIFWTMKSPNEDEFSLLGKWNLKPKSFDANVYIPEGQEKIFSSGGVEYDSLFSVLPSEFETEDWLSVFDIDPVETLGILLQRILGGMSGIYDIDDIVAEIRKYEGFDEDKLKLESFFTSAKYWGIFGKSKMPDMLQPGKLSIIDVSLTPQNVRSLLISFICKKIFQERTKARRKEELADIDIRNLGSESGSGSGRLPMPWIFIDEAHNYISDTKKTSATDILLKIVREGRQPGISLVVATQNPARLHPEVLAQTDLVISHRLTAKSDIDALSAIMQAYMLENIGKHINDLPKMKGVAVVLDDNSERVYKVRIRPRQSWHAGSTPTAITK